MSHSKQAGFSPPIVELQQVCVGQQPGAQPVYVGDNIVSADQPPTYSQVGQQPLVQQPLAPEPVVEQPQQSVPPVQRRTKRRNNGDPQCMKNRTGWNVAILMILLLLLLVRFLLLFSRF